MGNELKQYYANVIDSVGDGVIVLDENGYATLMNPAAEEITGVSRRQLIGNRFVLLFKNAPVLVEMVEKTASSGMTISDHENIVLLTAGGAVPVSATTSPLIQDDGRQIGTILVLRDLTNIRDLEQAVRRSDRLSALGTLAAGLAHEIKNPLGGISGAAQLMEMELPPESELRDYTGIMLKEAARVNRIVEELLDLTNPRKPELTRINLHQIIADIVILQKESVRGRDVTFHQQFDPSIPPIMADDGRLTQLFLNLVKNAVEAVGESGMIRITSRILSDYSMTQKGERRSRMVAIDIADDGPGIRQEEMEHLFTPFFTTKSKGTGLGLAICQKIVSEHRGMMKVQSDPGKGTTFTIMLPLIQ